MPTVLRKKAKEQERKKVVSADIDLCVVFIKVKREIETSK